jgi:hypothetical protein
MLYLNAGSGLIQHLSDQPSAQTGTVLDLVYQIARLFGGRFLSPADASQAYQEITDSIQGLMADD